MQYAPVIRMEPSGDEVVTWGEFKTPYPLATAKPYIYDKELVLELQERNDFPQSIAIVMSSGQTIALAQGRFASSRRSSSIRPETGTCGCARPAPLRLS